MNFFLFFSVFFVCLFFIEGNLSKARGNTMTLFCHRTLSTPKLSLLFPLIPCLVLPLSRLRLLWEMYRLPSSLEKMSRQSWQDGPFALPYGSVGRPSFLPSFLSTGATCLCSVPVAARTSLVSLLLCVCCVFWPFSWSSDVSCPTRQKIFRLRLGVKWGRRIREIPKFWGGGEGGGAVLIRPRKCYQKVKDRSETDVPGIHSVSCP